MPAILELANLGAFGLGFVFGWTLYFANRGKSGKISASDLGAMVTAIAGGTVLSAFGGADKSTVMGSYGVGLLVGFITYFALLWWFTRREEGQRPSSLLQSVNTDIAIDTRLDLLRSANLSAHLNRTSATTGNAAHGLLATGSATGTAIGIADEVLAEIDGLINSVAVQMTTATGSTFDELTKVEYRLQGLKMSLWSVRGIAALNTSEMGSLSAALAHETSQLNAEAERMKELTAEITKIDKLMGAMEKLRTVISSLV